MYDTDQDSTPYTDTDNSSQCSTVSDQDRRKRVKVRTRNSSEFLVSSMVVPGQSHCLRCTIDDHRFF